MAESTAEEVLTWAEHAANKITSMDMPHAVLAQWIDGRAFCAVISYYRPDLIDSASLKLNDHAANLRLAVSVAEHLCANLVLDSQSCEVTVLQGLVRITFVMQLHEFFKDQTPALSDSNKESSLLDQYHDMPTLRKSDLGGTEGGGFENCARCRQRIYLLERVCIMEKLYHRACFCCSVCFDVLKIGLYRQSQTADAFECLKHNITRDEAGLPVEEVAAASVGATDEVRSTSTLDAVVRAEEAQEPGGVVSLEQINESEQPEAEQPTASESAPQESEPRVSACESSPQESEPRVSACESSPQESEPRLCENEPASHQEDTNQTDTEAPPESEAVYENVVLGGGDGAVGEYNADTAHETVSLRTDAAGTDKDDSQPATTPSLAVFSSKQSDLSSNCAVDPNVPSSDNNTTEEVENKEKSPTPVPPPRRKRDQPSPLPPPVVVESADETRKVYPTDLNPFGTDEEEPELAAKDNPFGDTDESVVADVPMNNSRVDVTPSAYVFRGRIDYDDTLNPFGDTSESDDESDSASTDSRLSGANRRSLPAPPCATDASPVPSTDRRSLAVPSRPPPPSHKTRRAPAPMSHFGKSRPAPPRPMPLKRMINMDDHLTEAAVLDKFVQLDADQLSLEQEARVVEDMLHEFFAAHPDDDPITDFKLLDEWLGLLRRKIALVRQETELVYIRREALLDMAHSDVEFRLRCIMEKPESEKSPADLASEETLLQQLLDVIEEKNALVERHDRDQRRHAQPPENVLLEAASLAPEKAKENKQKVKKKKLKSRLKKIKKRLAVSSPSSSQTEKH